MEEKYSKWDNFMYQLIVCQTTAQKQYKYFIIMDARPHEVYDLLFHRAAMYANQFTDCKVYCYPHNFFRFIKFKWLEHQAHYPMYKARKYINSSSTHLCTYAERVQLIEELAKKCDINPEDLTTLYKEYYNDRFRY